MTELSLKQALSMDLGGYQVTQKMDGVTEFRDVWGFNVVGDRMKNGDFFAFDVIREIGFDTFEMPLKTRWQAMDFLVRNNHVQTAPCGNGVEFIEAVFANPENEGVVLKNWDSPFGYDWAKVKRVRTWDVRVTEKLQGAVAIEFENQSSGKVALAGRNYGLVQVGSIIEISAMNLTTSGKFREPKFLRVRFDKV